MKKGVRLCPPALGVPRNANAHPGARRAADGYERLPDILCIGEFLWARPVRDLSQMFSSATLVWFQDAFALPIAPEVLEELRELDWTRSAQDWSW